MANKLERRKFILSIQPQTFAHHEYLVKYVSYIRKHMKRNSANAGYTSYHRLQNNTFSQTVLLGFSGNSTSCKYCSNVTLIDTKTTGEN